VNLQRILQKIQEKYLGSILGTGKKIREGIMNVTNDQIQQYINGGRIPWSPGYKQYRMGLLQEAVRDADLLRIVKSGSVLPPHYGFGIDERIVEYPWVLSRLDMGPGHLLDAGSTLNYPYLLDLHALSEKSIIILTLVPEHMEKRANVSYLYGDLRDTLLRDNAFDWIVCISTLEHVGLDNTKLYTSNEKYLESSTQDYLRVVSELKRVLKPGGHLFVTVPFGAYHNFGWMQQFDIKGVDNIIRAFGSEPVETAFFRYLPDGWVISDADSCKTSEYFDVHSASEPAPDRAAAARAVACLNFLK